MNHKDLVLNCVTRHMAWSYGRNSTVVSDTEIPEQPEDSSTKTPNETGTAAYRDPKDDGEWTELDF